MNDTLNLLIPLATASGAVAFGALAAMSIAPRCGAFGAIVHRGPPRRKDDDSSPPRVALTFDDGPTAISTERVLDALRDLQAPATFFVVGQNAQRNPALLIRMHDEGHVIANHSFDHWHYGFLGNARYWESQIARTDAVIEQMIGLRPTLFRPPMGVKTWFIARAARRLGHTVVTWSRRAMDGIRTTPQRICDRVVPRACDGDVIALHDGVEPNICGRDQMATVQALAPLVRGLRDRGLEIVRLDQLIGVAPYV